jgi:hypothetical protein
MPLISTLPSSITAGCTMPSPAQACIQSSLPSRGSTLDAPSPLMIKICSTPSMVASCGEL